MAYSEHLAERIRHRINKTAVVKEKRMMGGLIFMINGKMCVGVDIDKATGLDRLMVRIGKSAYSELLFYKGSREMNITGKVMQGFLFVSPEGFASDKDLHFWIDKAMDFNKL